MSAGAFAAQAYTPYFTNATGRTNWQPESYDPESRTLVVKDMVGNTQTIKGVTHSQVKTWCKMPSPDVYLEHRILADPRIQAINAKKPAKGKGSEEG